MAVKLTTAQKNSLLLTIADAIESEAASILAANERDLQEAVLDWLR